MLRPGGVLLLMAAMAGCGGPRNPAPASAPPAAAPVRVLPVGLGWARNSINAVVFRGSSVASYGDAQYTA